MMMMRLSFLLLLFSTCVDADGRIIGGSIVTDEDEFPYFAIVQSQLVDDTGKESGRFCGGTLISPRTVLTAAHCVDSEDIVFTVVSLGRMRKQDSSSDFDQAAVSSITIHPSFSRQEGQNDIAVLRLEDPMPDYKPARVPFGVGRVPEEDDDVTVLGFGVTSPGSSVLSDELRQVSLEVKKRNDCDKYGHPFANSNKFCADADGKVSFLLEVHVQRQLNANHLTATKQSPCGGDSGGPAIAYGDEVVGIVSSGGANCDGTTTFTRVSAYENFIRNAVCQGPGQPSWCSRSDGRPDMGIGACFHGSSLVNVQDDRGVVLMQDLELGDMVHVGGSVYEPIYSFGHRAPNAHSIFLQITTEQSKLRLTPDHMLFTPLQGAVPASLLQVGDYLLDADGSHDRIQGIESVKDRGLYAPFTPSGKIIVNDIQASSYVALEQSRGLEVFSGLLTLSHQWLSHSIQFPHRLACCHLGTCPSERYSPEGISLWMDQLMQVGQWLLRGPKSLRLLWTIPLSLVAALFTMMEIVVLRPWMMVALFLLALVLSKRGFKTKKA